jgi:hypothetical protein
MLMITFRTAYMPTEDADTYKFHKEETPMEYNEAMEVEYNPDRALSLKESNDVEESYGFAEQAGGDAGANVATGVAVGAASGVGAGAAAYGSSSFHEDNVSQSADGSIQEADSSQSPQQPQNDASFFDTRDWLGDPGSVGAQY